MGQINLSERLSETRVRLERERNGKRAPTPKFLQLTRKEARVREDQYAELSALARTLMRDRVSRRERITENTLIRVAIDLLFANRDHLRGSDEEELRRSVTSGVPDFGSPKVTGSRSSAVADPETPEARDSQGPMLPKSRARRDRHLGSSIPPVPGAGARS